MRTILCLAICASAGAVPGAAAENHALLIAGARAGDFAPAIARIEERRRAKLASAAEVADLALIYHWAGRHAEAVGLYRGELSTRAPAWLLLPMARSALAARDSTLAREAAQAAPADGDERYVVASIVADSLLQESRLGEACAAASAALPPLPSEYRQPMLPALFSRADCEERKGDFVSAAATYHAIARLEPRQPRAIRNKAFALRHAGAGMLAWKLAQAHRELFDATELASLQHEAQGAAVRHGEVASQAPTRAERVAGLDRALAVNAEALRAGARVDTRYDRYVALRNRTAMAEAVRDWEASAAGERDRAPAYVRAAVADAYLYLERPQDAERLYRDAIGTQAAAPAGWRIGLYYALLESEQHAAAGREIDALVANTPRAIFPNVPGLEDANPEYLQVRMLHALHRLYADRLGEAEAAIATMREEAPFSSTVRAAWISLLTSREQPRAAYAEAQRLATDDPDSFEARMSLAGLAFDLRRWQESRERLQALRAQEPDNKSVHRQLASLRRHESWFLRVEALVGHGGGPNPRESRFDAQLYSPPFAPEWRAVVTDTYIPENDREGAPARNRVGAGVDWRSGDWSATAVATRIGSGPKTAGADLKLARTLSDHHALEGAIEVNTRDLPVRAFINGITANLAQVSYVYSRNESRKVVVTAAGHRFSDGNRRSQAGIEWRERLYADARMKADASLGASFSRNTRDDRPYFSPASDASLQLGLAGEWLTWRDYRRTFRQRASGAFGAYRQQAFGTRAYAELRYGHEWETRDAWALAYGIGWSTRPYDGVQERSPFGYLTLSWYPG